MKEIHEIQRKILLKLLFSKGMRYIELKPDHQMENSQFDFHLDTLQSQKYIEKVQDLYLLTSSGKEYANRFDSDSTKFKIQAKLSVWVASCRDTAKGREYLMYTRLKNPFFGAQGFLAGKLDFGELVEQGAKRELFEETTLVGEPKLVHIRHYINKDKKTGAVIEDKFMFLCLVKNPTGNASDSVEGKHEWVHSDDFKTKVTNHFENYESFLYDIALLENFDGKVTFEERTEFPEKF